MKGSRFSDAQKAFILKQGADGTPVPDICGKAGIKTVRSLAKSGQRLSVDRLHARLHEQILGSAHWPFCDLGDVRFFHRCRRV